MASAADSDHQVVLSREPNHLQHIGSAGATRDQSGPLVDCGIPHAPGGVVAVVGWAQQLASNTSLQLLDRGFRAVAIVMWVASSGLMESSSPQPFGWDVLDATCCTAVYSRATSPCCEPACASCSSLASIRDVTPESRAQ